MIRDATDRAWARIGRAVLARGAMRVMVMVVALWALPMTALADERAQSMGQLTGGVHLRAAGDDDLGAALQSSVESLSAATRNLRLAGDRSTRAAEDARWTWPLLGPEVVMSRFDGPPKPWLPGHRGVDLAGFEGAPVRAVADGMVSYQGVINGVGVVSVLHDDGVLSTYQPVLGGLPLGSPVPQGGLIGTLGAAGSHCWPLSCLHLGARIQKTYIDPMLYLRQWEVSLLPGRSR